MNPNQIALFIGLFGSVHCIGMCGPLAFAIPAGNRGGKWLLVADKLLYNLGRTLSYTLLGLVMGLAGRQLWLMGLQQGISVVSGVLIILAASSRLFKISLLRGGHQDRFLGYFNKLMIKAIQNRWGHLATGILNGFLPCGFVYLALVGAINTGSVWQSAQYMFWFGIGTLPLMLLATISSGLMTVSLRRKFNRVIPYFMLCLGLWFVLRGLSLNIPYLSPAPVSSGVVCH